MNPTNQRLTLLILKSLDCKWAITSSVDVPNLLKDHRPTNKEIYENWVTQYKVMLMSQIASNKCYIQGSGPLVFSKRKKIEQDKHPSISTHANWIKDCLVALSNNITTMNFYNII